jgi:hypothetical protein
MGPGKSSAPSYFWDTTRDLMVVKRVAKPVLLLYFVKHVLFEVSFFERRTGMIKKTAIILFVCSLCATIFPPHAPAANQQTEDALLKDILTPMKPACVNIDQAGDLAPISSKTAALIDALSHALKEDDPESLQPAVEDYRTALDLMREQQLVPECRDALLSGLYYSGWSLLQTLSGGGYQVCTSLSAGSIIADILIALQSYQLCVIDNSEVPDEALRETICQQQKLVKTYNFIAGWLYVTQCSYDASFITYFTLIVNFLTVFSVCA